MSINVRHEPDGYSKSMCFHIDSLPLDLILANFPKDKSVYLKDGQYLYEYIVDIRTVNP